eukprot:SAG25_NODE_7454_length_479_cov_2.102632_1_plen_30_part_01
MGLLRLRAQGAQVDGALPQLRRDGDIRSDR